MSETDREGLNVRSGPGTRFGIVGRLPPVAANADDLALKGMVEVTVKAGADGWFLIADARDNELLTGAPPRPMFSGEGWVSGTRLTVKSQADQGRLAPDATARAVVTVRGGSTLDIGAVIDATRLLGCRGAWALVEIGPVPDGDVRSLLAIEPDAAAGAKPGAFRAWLDRICAIQETSCSGP